MTLDARLACVCFAAIHGHRSRQCADELVEADQLGAHRGGQFGDPEAGEVVGLHGSVEFVPRHLEDGGIREAEALQDHDGAIPDGRLQPA